jgi:hypothetical protein
MMENLPYHNLCSSVDLERERGYSSVDMEREGGGGRRGR